MNAKEALSNILMDVWASVEMSSDDVEDLQDNAPESICADIRTALQTKIFWDTGPINLAQHAFKTSPIAFMSPRIE